MHTVPVELPTTLLNGGCALAASVLVRSLHASHLMLCAGIADSAQKPVLVLLLALCMPAVHARGSFGGSGAGLLRVHPAYCCIWLNPCQDLAFWLHQCSFCSQENPVLPKGLVLGVRRLHACLNRGLTC